MDARCKATTVAGSPCSARPVREDGYCWWHSPALEAERLAGRVRGGKAKSNAARARKDLPPAMTTAELQQVLGGVLRGTLAGRIAPHVANACAALGRTLIAVRKATEVEERLAALEAAARRDEWRSGA